MAMAVTQIAAATAALSWMFVEWILRGKPSVLGIISGAVGGLVAITTIGMTTTMDTTTNTARPTKSVN